MENSTWTDFTELDQAGMTSAAPGGPPPMPAYLDYGLAFFLFIAFIFGVLGNGTTIWIFLRTKSLRTAPNMLIVNLAFSDVAMVLTNFPLMFASTLHGSWLFGELICEIYAFCGALFGFMSITTMTAIALDRHYVICHSMEAIRTVTKRRALYKVILVWIYSSIWSILPFVGFGAYVLEGYGVNCTFEYLDLSLKNRLYVGTIFIFGFILPLGIIIASYGHIAFTLREHRLQLMKVQHDLRAPGNDKAQAAAIKRVKADKVEWQIAKIGMMLTVLFCMSWMPYATVAFIGEFIDDKAVTPMVQVLPVVLAKSSASWNPLVYAISHQRFKEALRDRFLNYCCGGTSGQPTRSGQSTNRMSSTAKGGGDSRATSMHSVTSEVNRERDRTATVMSTASTRTEEVDIEGGGQGRPSRSSLRAGKERARREGDEPALPEQSPSVGLVMKSAGGSRDQRLGEEYDNPASTANDRDELTKL